ncbi:MAG: beta-ketoacyl synthase N-terminal-like domain-containing protein [Myxococcota bacterium]|nr:beta-ketoacyl synthase N-terminal-like domain-containing protein [Myxococcota bacterium]
MSAKVYVAGGAITPFIGKGNPDFIWKRHPDFGTRENPSLKDYLVRAVSEAAEATGVDLKQVDKAYVANFVGELFVNQGHLGAALAGSHPDLAGKPSMRVEGACASGGLAMAAGVDAIKAGADLVLVAGVEVQTTASARTGGDYLARAADYERQRPMDDFTFPALFARRMKAYRTAFDVSEEDVGRVAVKAYNNANKNPLAHMRARKVDLEFAKAPNDKNPNFLSNEEFSPWLKVTDCSQVSDGGAAMFLVSEAGIEKLGLNKSDCIELVGIGQATASLYEDGDLTEMSTTKLAAERAYGQANLGPMDVQVAEVHDCFTIAELLMYEALGFAERGKAAELVKEGVTDLDGRLPVNTGGGLVGFGHPVGATGVKQVLEIWRQMKGRCGDYQVSNNPKVGLTANMGGDDKSVVVALFQDCA